MYQASKHRQVEKLNIVPKAGINIALSADTIKDDECAMLYNMWYPRNARTPEVRRALVCNNGSPATKLPSAIIQLYSYVKTSSDLYLICVSGDNLYYLDVAPTSLAAWVNTTTYADGDRVLYGGFAWISKKDNNTGNVPGVGSGVALSFGTDPLTFGTGAVTFGPVGSESWVRDPEWSLIHSIAAGSNPALLTFNGKLLIGDGTGLYSWDGTTWATITTVIQPNALFEINNRVVANDMSATGLDAVAFSAVEDETGWTFTAAGGAILLRAGYKDGLTVNGFASFQDDLIVSKTGGGFRVFYRVNVGGDPYDASGGNSWSIDKLFHGDGCSGPHLIKSIREQIIYASPIGIKGMIGSQEYGDFIPMDVGKKINAGLGEDTPAFVDIEYIPLYEQLWAIPEDQNMVFLYHPHNGAWTTINLSGLDIRTVCQQDESVYLAGTNGYLYSVGGDSLTDDEVSPGEYTPVYSIVRTKFFDFAELEAMVKETIVYISPKTTGKLYLDFLHDRGKTKTFANQFQLITESSYDEDLFLWTMDLYSFNEDLYGVGTPPILAVSRAKSRGSDIAIQLRISGRCGISAIRCEIALMGGSRTK